MGEEFAIAALLVRDFKGMLVFLKSEKVPSLDPSFVEAVAMSLASSTAVDLFGSSFCWFEGDAKVVVDSILNPDDISYRPIFVHIHNYCSLVSSLPIWHISHTIRSMNVYAHNVAR